MTAPQVVPEDAPARITVTSPLVHLCPHVDEVDEGSAVISWTCAGATLELHSLAAYLGTFAEERVSHEELTHALQWNLGRLHGIADVHVATSWTTAGMLVQVNGAPR